MKNRYKLILLFLATFLFTGCGTSASVVEPVNTTINNFITNIEDGGLTTENGTLVMIDYFHYKNHLGAVYLTNFNQTMSTGATLYFMGCPTTKEMHFIELELKSENALVMIELYENPTVTNNGTQINLTNTNRVLNYPHTSNIYYNPTVTVDGTLLFRDFILSGQGNNAQGPFFQEGEIILSSSYCYVIKVTNQDGNNNDVVGTLFMYEE